jgi:hypothetical protein
VCWSLFARVASSSTLTAVNRVRCAFQDSLTRIVDARCHHTFSVSRAVAACHQLDDARSSACASWEVNAADCSLQFQRCCSTNSVSRVEQHLWCTPQASQTTWMSSCRCGAQVPTGFVVWYPRAPRRRSARGPSTESPPCRSQRATPLIHPTRWIDNGVRHPHSIVVSCTLSSRHIRTNEVARAVVPLALTAHLSRTRSIDCLAIEQDIKRSGRRRSMLQQMVQEGGFYCGDSKKLKQATNFLAMLTIDRSTISATVPP